MRETFKEAVCPKNLTELLSKVYHLTLFTTGQCIILDRDNNQIPELQLYFIKRRQNRWLFSRIAEQAEKFSLCKFRKWKQDLGKEDFIKITRYLHFVDLEWASEITLEDKH
jgi:hypothetical protein